MGDYGIKQARDAKGWTQTDPAKAIGAIIPVRRVKPPFFADLGYARDMLHMANCTDYGT